MTEVLQILVVSAIGGVAGSLVTVLVTPRLQYEYWRRERRDELRLAAIREVNKLVAELLYYQTEAVARGASYTPSGEFFQALTRAAADVKALFSTRAFQTFKAMEAMIGPKLGTPEGRWDIEQLRTARDAVLSALYAEVVPVGTWRWPWWRGGE